MIVKARAACRPARPGRDDDARLVALLGHGLERGVVHHDGGPHGGGDVRALPVDALGAGGAVGVDGVHDRLEVLEQVLGLEVQLAEGDVHDALLVRAELHLAALELTHRLDHVGGDGARLGVGHQALGAQRAAQLGSLGHHVRAGDEQVEVREAVGDLLHQILGAREVRPRSLGGGDGVTLAQHGDAHLLTGALGEGDGGTQLLVVVLGVDVEADVRLRALVELRRGVLPHHVDARHGRLRVHAPRHVRLRLAEALRLPRLLRGLAILAHGALRRSREELVVVVVVSLGHHRLLQLRKVQPGRGDHALPATRGTTHLHALRQTPTGALPHRHGARRALHPRTVSRNRHATGRRDARPRRRHHTRRHRHGARESRHRV
mmetsp:Transcript_5270/g.13427  ORF Transcript_5270/g.13427 Transcript_5270/m.13427 type:complete len:377 (-) Transcript_5270:49-1179(-)